MQLDVFSKWTLIISALNLLVTACGAIFIVISLHQTNHSIRQSAKQYTYGVWRTIYDQLDKNPSILTLFGLSPADVPDIHQLASFLTVLDMYASSCRENYHELCDEAMLLPHIMKSDLSRQLWARYKTYFFSEPDFIAEVDALAAQ